MGKKQAATKNKSGLEAAQTLTSAQRKITLSRQVQKEKTEEQAEQKQKKQNTKNVLCSPFEVSWPYIDNESIKEVQSILKQFLGKHSLERPKLSCSIKDKTKRKEERAALYSSVPEKTKKLAKLLVIGINGVTKGLERKQLSLVLVDKSAKPTVLTDHLIGLAAVNKCPAAAIPNFSSFISPLIHVTSAVSIGFRKSKGEFKELEETIDRVGKKLPPVTVPWLNSPMQPVETNNSTVGEHSTIVVNDDNDTTDNLKDTSQTDRSAEQSTVVYDNSDEDRIRKDSSKREEMETDPNDTFVDVRQFYIWKRTAAQKRKKAQKKRKKAQKAEEESNLNEKKSGFDKDTDFIPFGASSEEEEEEKVENVGFTQKFKDRKRKNQSDESFRKYENKKPKLEAPKARKLVGNPNKVNKKKKRNKNKV